MRTEMVSAGDQVDVGECDSLFHTTVAKGRLVYKLFVGSVFLGICLVWVYRATQVPGHGSGRWPWLGLFAAEVWFGLYWILTQSLRWNPTYRRTFRDKLSRRYKRDELPGVDVFVCTADHTAEPPAMVISTVLSVMAYDYPSEKLAVYLSDDGGSILTFYALLEASSFAKVWIPFCHKFQLEPRSPAAYFRENTAPPASVADDEWWAIQRSFKEMENKIDTATRLGKIPEDVWGEHKGFSEWNQGVSSRDHQPIVQILIDGMDPNPTVSSVDGNALPTLVYVAREKRPHRHHNFKAGAMNSLIRVSSEISNGSVILNVDCDMYSNDSKSVRDALCFFMDERQGDQIGYVQFPQKFNNISKNDVYGNSLRLFCEVDFHGIDGLGGPLYVGSGCFHRRWSLLGNKYGGTREKDSREVTRSTRDGKLVLEEKAKSLAACTYEDNTQWGKKVGLKYGCPVEDVISGLSIQCSGWKSVYFNPQREAFLGIAPVTLEETLVQHKRWSEGDFQIFLSKYCPFVYGYGNIQLGLQMAYCVYCLWAPKSVPTLYHVLVSSLYLIKGIPLFPKVSSAWFIPFMFVFIVTLAHNIWESLQAGFSLKSWLNDQRMKWFKTSTSYLFASVDTLLQKLGFNQLAFVITTKVADKDVIERYEKDIMEFGSSPMIIILATQAVWNLLCMGVGVKKLIVDGGFEDFFLHFFICSLLMIVYVPIYQGLFFRKDNARIPTTVTLISTALVVLIYLLLCRV